MGVHSLFEKPTAEFHVPLINLGGWADINSRAEMMRRFNYWERRDKKCVLLVFNDHDPGGLLSPFLAEECIDLPGAVGWSPRNSSLIRFGLKPVHPPASFGVDRQLETVGGAARRSRSQRSQQGLRPVLHQEIWRTEGRGERTAFVPKPVVNCADRPF